MPHPGSTNLTYAGGQLTASTPRPAVTSEPTAETAYGRSGPEGIAQPTRITVHQVSDVKL